MTAKKTVKKISNEVKKLGKKDEIKFLRNLYTDFKEVMEEGLGDAGKIFKKHKLLLVIAFIGYLLFRNKQFSIEGFVKKLEERIRADKEW